LTFDASGNLWFIEFEANCIGFFNAHTHTFVENPIPTPDSNPYGITRDPLENIWFTENNEGIGRIGSLIPTPSGMKPSNDIEISSTTLPIHFIFLPYFPADNAGQQCLF